MTMRLLRLMEMRSKNDQPYPPKLRLTFLFIGEAVSLTLKKRGKLTTIAKAEDKGFRGCSFCVTLVGGPTQFPATDFQCGQCKEALESCDQWQDGKMYCRGKYKNGTRTDKHCNTVETFAEHPTKRRHCAKGDAWVCRLLLLVACCRNISRRAATRKDISVGSLGCLGVSSVVIGCVLTFGSIGTAVAIAISREKNN